MRFSPGAAFAATFQLPASLRIHAPTVVSAAGPKATSPSFVRAAISSQKNHSRRPFAERLGRVAAMSSTGESPLASDDSVARISLCQFRVTENKLHNIETCRKFVREAVRDSPHLIVLPEIWNGPYATAAFGEYAEPCPEVGATAADVDNDVSPSVAALLNLAVEHGVTIVGGSIPELASDGGNIYNTCLVISADGVVVAKHRKAHLFDISVPGGVTFRESDTLSPGSEVTVVDLGSPLGMIGVGICYDIRFPEMAAAMVRAGARVLVYPGAFNMTTGPAHWELLARGRANDGQCYVLLASPARSDDENGPDGKYPKYTAWGHSTVCGPWGDVLVKTDEGEGIVRAELDMAAVERVRTSVPTRNQKRYDLYTPSEII